MRLILLAVVAGLMAAPAFAQEHDAPACLATDAVLSAALSDWNGKAAIGTAPSPEHAVHAPLSLGKGYEARLAKKAEVAKPAPKPPPPAPKAAVKPAAKAPVKPAPKPVAKAAAAKPAAPVKPIAKAPAKPVPKAAAKPAPKPPAKPAPKVAAPAKKKR